jgi:predicted hydrolase (HD superfamily)
MSLPSKDAALALLHQHVREEYQRHHALMVATAMEGYAQQYVEAHAYGYHGFTTLPETRLAAALVACDELSGIFYAYRKMNPVPYGQMKAASIRKKFKDPGFAAKIDRATIQLGCDKLGVPLDDHIANLVKFFASLP